MAMRFEAEELDRDTLAYLKGAARQQGVYLSAREAGLWPNVWTIAAAIGGPAIVLLTVVTSRGLLQDPTAIALYLTAGSFLGGWMLLAALRCLLARRRDDYLGHFKLVDPLYLWHADGRGVWVTPLEMLVSIHRRSRALTLELADQTVRLRVRPEAKAAEVEAFLTTLLDARPPVAEGTIPQPHKARTSRGWVRYPVLAAAGVLLFFACRLTADAIYDDGVYRAVRGQEPPDLRWYLLDPRNSRHKGEVIAELGRFHEAAAARLQGTGDQALCDGLADIVRGLTGEPRPVVTFLFVPPEEKAEDPEKYLSSAVLQTLQGQIVKDVTGILTQQVGFGLVDVAEVSEPPAMVELRPQVLRKEGGRMTQLTLAWTLTLQAGAGSRTHTCRMKQESAVMGDDVAGALRRLYPAFPALFRTRLLTR